MVVEQRVIVSAQKDLASYEYLRERKLYVRMVERVRQTSEFSGGTVTTVDATGLGIVVSEDLRRRRLRGELYPVVITGGLEGKYRDGFYPTPRTELLIGVQKAFEQQRLGVAGDVVGCRRRGGCGLRRWASMMIWCLRRRCLG